MKLQGIQLVSHLRGWQTGKESFGVAASNQLFSKQGGKEKKPPGEVNQNKISNNIHVPPAKGTRSLPFLNMEHTRTETSRKAQTGGGFGKWIKSFNLEK